MRFKKRKDRLIPVIKHACVRCGSCCKAFIVDANLSDVLREPFIAKRCRVLNGDGILAPSDCGWRLAGRPRLPCAFLDISEPVASCKIYNNRPGVCASFEPGGDQCNRARKKYGLKPLRLLQAK